jgi:hypothetical protein
MDPIGESADGTTSPFVIEFGNDRDRRSAQAREPTD